MSMHEMSICESIVQTIESHARRDGFSRVLKVRLEIGCFGGVEPEALRFGFDVVTRGTCVEGAELDILGLPGRAWCFGCGEAFDVDSRVTDCPACGSARLRITGGDELRIKDLEVA